MSVIIAGGGIGGLVTALSLHRIGVDVTVYEQVEQVRPLGVGINLLPHAVRVLTELGLQDALRAVAIETSDLSYWNRFGQEIWTEPRGLGAGYLYPQFSIHRGELQMILFDAAKRILGADRIKTGHRIAGFDELPNGRIKASFNNQAGETIATQEADLLIAADGIHSTIRARFYPNEGPPIWNGRVLWRAITHKWKPFLTGRSMIMAGHQDEKFVCYPISRAESEKGTPSINWIAELTFDPSKGWRKEDWNRVGKLEDFAPRFDKWTIDWLDVPALIRGAETVYEYPLVDRNPVDRWSFGPVTLLGDAAHPMYPIGSNGASQAILDADCLARCVAAQGETSAALEAYDAERRPATTAIVLANRGNGPELVMQLTHERAPDGFTNIDDVVPRTEREAIANRYKQVAGFSRDAVNTAKAASPAA